ncbi:MAG: transcription/translation regulatory transformer protein RfaH [Herminiimonas sp.]|nr:transcription/translation regulatory transformer protein RfaH [Herminiimonas sp.]
MSESAQAEAASWYVVQTKSRQEFRALEQLENQRYTCFLPTLSNRRIRGGKPQTSIEPLFSRYLFVQLTTHNTNWSPIRSTRGVTSLVAFGGRFATLPNACVDAMRAIPHVKFERAFQAGEKVAVIDGAFAGLEGIYQLSDGTARALLLIDMISQPQKLAFAVNALKKVA